MTVEHFTSRPGVSVARSVRACGTYFRFLGFCMISYCKHMSRATMPMCVRHVIMGLMAVLVTGLADPACAKRRGEAKQVETVAARPAGVPLMAIISLGDQRVTIYDADGWILRAPVSSGQSGRETPAGIFSVLQNCLLYTSPSPRDGLLSRMPS